jgi:hypothetical protein
VKHIQYLGATISYYNFERQTMLARLKAGDKTSQQLTRWLHTSKGFNTFQKIKVWRQCTFACIRYSLIPIGFTASTLRLFDIACIKHLRRICRAPTHLHHTTHQEFLFEHGIIDPFELLLHFCTKAEQRDTQRRSTLAANDILLTFPAIPFHERRQVLLEEWQRLRERWHLFDVPEPDSQQECPVCSMIFVTQAALRRHLTLVHGSRAGHCANHTHLMHVRDSQHVDNVDNVLLLGPDFNIMCNMCVHKLGRNQQLHEKTQLKKLSTDLEFRSFCNLPAATFFRHWRRDLTYWHIFTPDAAYDNISVSRLEDF